MRRVVDYNLIFHKYLWGMCSYTSCCRRVAWRLAEARETPLRGSKTPTTPRFCFASDLDLC